MQNHAIQNQNANACSNLADLSQVKNEDCVVKLETLRSISRKTKTVAQKNRDRLLMIGMKNEFKKEEVLEERADSSPF